MFTINFIQNFDYFHQQNTMKFGSLNKMAGGGDLEIHYLRQLGIFMSYLLKFLYLLLRLQGRSQSFENVTHCTWTVEEVGIWARVWGFSPKKILKIKIENGAF